MNKKQKKTLERILIAVALVIVLKLLPALPMPVELALYCIPCAESKASNPIHINLFII